MKIKELIDEEVSKRVEELGTMDINDENYSPIVTDITKLADKAIELHKIDSELEEKRREHEVEIEEKRKQHEAETAIEQKKLEIERKDKFVKNCITVGTFAITTGIGVWGTLTSMQFEKDENWTSFVGRKFVDMVTPKKS